MDDRTERAHISARGTVSGETYLELVEKYNALRNKYDVLDREHRDALNRLSQARVKVHDAKKVVKEWQRYYDSHPKYQADHTKSAQAQAAPADGIEATPKPPRRLPVEESRDSFVGEEPKEPEDELPILPTKVPTPTVSPRLRAQYTSSGTHPTVTRSSSRVHHNPSSETTEGEIETQLPKVVQDDDDEPVVVSERRLRTRLSSGSRVRKVDCWRQDGTPDRPVNIKEESFSSPVRGFYSRQPLRSETSDLDAMVGDTETPRKPGQFRDVLKRYKKTGSMANPSNKESRVTLKDSGQSLRSSTVSTTENNANTIISVLEQQEDADLNVDEADDGNQDQENSQDSISMKSEPSPGVTRQSKPPARKLPWASRYRDASNRQSRAPLKTLSPNTPTVSRSGTGSAKRRRSDEDHGANAIHQLSEDGPKDAPQTAKKAKLTPQSAATSKVRGQRLLNLLQGDDGPAHKEVLTPKTVVRKPHIRDQRQQLVTPESSSARNSKRLTRSNSPRTVVPTSRMARIRPQQSHNKDEDEEGSPPPARPEDEPLRSRPLARLNLDDFKINPSYTGSDFAFSETIRGRDARRNLQGRALPEFQWMAQMGAIPTPPRRQGGLFSSQESGDTHDTHAAEDRELAAYLGSEWKKVLEEIGPSHRGELLVQARAQAFADAHGRQRHAFERRQSPPGFWEVDMPDTQEEDRRREEAGVRDREETKKRWLDAMRGNGKWMFRDE